MSLASKEIQQSTSQNEVDKFCLKFGATIREAMQVIQDTEERACFLIDDEQRLQKVISDGDIRRALLDGKQLTDAVDEIHDREPFVIKEGQDIKAARKYLSRRITVIPVINNLNQVTGVVRLHDVEPFMNIKTREVLILGMGYVGLTLAVILADEGFGVTGYDTNEQLIGNLKEKRASFHEKGLQNYLDKHVNTQLKLTTSLDQHKADIYVITVGTPIVKPAYEPNVEYIRQATESIGKILKKNDLVILRSTVPVGLTRKVALATLEKTSGLKCGEDFYLAYCPERTAEGKALEELRKNPQIIGGFDRQSTELASRLFNENTHTVIDVGSLEAAEMCKLLDNTYRDAIFAYSNQMAQLCEKVGLNLNELIEKVNLQYTRNLIPKPSPGVGGACLSKDPYILMQNFQEFDLDTSYIRAARVINESAPQQIYSRSQVYLQDVGKSMQQAKVFIVGFAFKGSPETSDLRDSTTLWILDEFKKQGVANIYGYDPVVDNQELINLEVKPVALEEGFESADAVYFLNNHRSYAGLPIYDLIDAMNKPALFFDGWHNFVPMDIKNIPGIIFSGVGVG